MTRDEQQAILAIALMAAFADGQKHDAERAEIRQIVDALAQAGEPNLPALYQQVLLKQVTLDSVAARLPDADMRQLAFEMAVGVCDADGAQSPPERAFLAELQGRLGLEAQRAGAVGAGADALASLPMDRPTPIEVQVEGPLAVPAPGRAGAPAGAAPGTSPADASGGAPSGLPGTARTSSMSDAEIDKLILNYAILNGGLELLPDSLSTLAIIPLQVKLVYRIGKSYGYELDPGHAKEFLATVGVGLTSQYLEQAGRQLLGGLLRTLGGRALGGLGRQAASSAMSFASTWALGQVARRYYAGGRVLTQDALRQAFAGLLTEAKSLQQQYLPQIESRARSIDMQQVMAAIRG